MTEALRMWILGITGAAIITAITMTVSPEGRVKRVSAIVCGFMIIAALLLPIEGFDFQAYRLNFNRLREQAESFSDPLKEADKNLARIIIEEKYAAYISDKGRRLGINDLDVAVTAVFGGGETWYPGEVRLATDADRAKRDRLAYDIESGLGVPPEELIWGDKNEG